VHSAARLRFARRRVCIAGKPVRAARRRSRRSRLNTDARYVAAVEDSERERRRRATERPRLLARRSEHGYTDRPHAALPHEPEAVDAVTQKRITDRAHRRADDRQRAAWREASAQIADALARLRSGRLDPKYTSTLRVIERARARLDQQVGI
jgi:hypothetical protein